MDNPVSWMILCVAVYGFIGRIVSVELKKIIAKDEAKKDPKMKYDIDYVFFDQGLTSTRCCAIIDNVRS